MPLRHLVWKEVILFPPITLSGPGIFTDLALPHRQKGISWLGLMIGLLR